MSISVSIRKKYEDDKVVIYNYGKLKNEIGEFSIQKENLGAQQITPTQEVIDRIMYFSAASKVISVMQRGEMPPDITSFNS